LNHASVVPPPGHRQNEERPGELKRKEIIVSFLKQFLGPRLPKNVPVKDEMKFKRGCNTQTVRHGPCTKKSRIFPYTWGKRVRNFTAIVLIMSGLGIGTAHAAEKCEPLSDDSVKSAVQERLTQMAFANLVIMDPKKEVVNGMENLSSVADTENLVTVTVRLKDDLTIASTVSIVNNCIVLVGPAFRLRLFAIDRTLRH
jgi:hypothetical protein